MSQTIHLSPDDDAVNLVKLQQSPAPTARSGAEFVSYWTSEGLIGTRNDIEDSSAHARSLREAAERRRA
jgi:hypothetical protein